jgi:hypothetical protein
MLDSHSWYGYMTSKCIVETERHLFVLKQNIHIVFLYDAAFPKPNIECPCDISVETEPGQPTAFVAFPQPVTDVDWFRSV